MESNIRTIEVEFLRSGPPHNQLLSPLTQYLAVCGDAGAGTVTIPFEQAAFNRRLSNLRYQLDSEEDESLRLESLRTTGGDLGAVLNEVPGLIGALAQISGGEQLVNLRVITSASELALLPFEMSKVPFGSGRPSEEWLGLRPGTPVCITRRVRSVTPSQGSWPTSRPKVLMIVGLGIDDDLKTQHERALSDALAPWRRSSVEKGSGRPEDEGHEPLRVLEAPEATMRRIREELECDDFTAIHILAHGAEIENAEGERYGLLLKGSGISDGDVITGERFASALRSMPAGKSLPAAVVAASCDSAYQAEIVVPGGSFAQALHMIGVPLVVASQFPLTYEGSVRLTEMVYGDVLWGCHPLPALASARAALHAELGHTHDWASLVVYDALPDNLGSQLEGVQYRRAKDAMEDALADLDRTDQPSEMEIREATKRAEAAIDQLPDSALYAMEVGGLKASYAKRLSEYLFRSGQFADSRQQLEIAHRTYREAAHRFYSTGGAQHKASLNWLETQTLSLDWVLQQESEFGSWEIAVRSCQRDLADGDFATKAWAHGSLAELYLLQVFTAGEDEDELDNLRDLAMYHTAQLLEYYPRATDFPVFSTQRQFMRYVEWWGSAEFVEGLGPAGGARSSAWEHVIELAGELVGILDRAIQDDQPAGD